MVFFDGGCVSFDGDSVDSGDRLCSYSAFLLTHWGHSFPTMHERLDKPFDQSSNKYSPVGSKMTVHIAPVFILIFQEIQLAKFVTTSS